MCFDGSCVGFIQQKAVAVFSLQINLLSMRLFVWLSVKLPWTKALIFSEILLSSGIVTSIVFVSFAFKSKYFLFTLTLSSEFLYAVRSMYFPSKTSIPSEKSLIGISQPKSTVLKNPDSNLAIAKWTLYFRSLVVSGFVKNNLAFSTLALSKLKSTHSLLWKYCAKLLAKFIRAGIPKLRQKATV